MNRLVQIADPMANLELETPAGTVYLRGTTSRVRVTPCPPTTATTPPRPFGLTPEPTGCGLTRVANLPDGTGGTVEVEGKDPSASRVTLQPGQDTIVVAGQPPSSPTAMSAGAGSRASA